MHAPTATAVGAFFVTRKGPMQALEAVSGIFPDPCGPSTSRTSNGPTLDVLRAGTIAGTRRPDGPRLHEQGLTLNQLNRDRTARRPSTFISRSVPRTKEERAEADYYMDRIHQMAGAQPPRRGSLPRPAQAISSEEASRRAQDAVLDVVADRLLRELEREVDQPIPCFNAAARVEAATELKYGEMRIVR